MLKYVAAVCLFAFVAAQHHGGNNNHNHHPHPGGDIHCGQTADCPPCNDNQTVVCENHLCVCQTSAAVRDVLYKRAGETCSADVDCPACDHGVPKCEVHHGTTGHCHCAHAKRATCHNNHECDGTCPDGQNGVCNSQNHCECGNHGKRAGETCSADVDCPACDHGVPKCEVHHGTTGHCHCAHAKRATCHNNHECDGSCPDGQNGVCNSQNHCECGNHGKRAGETCSADVDCPACDHGVPKCEVHHGTTGHCHCAHAKRATCHSNHECDATCPDGQNGVCNSQKQCECGNHGKRAGETCSADVDCPACDHGVPKCEIHHGTTGHCHCAHAKRATCHSNHECDATCPDGQNGVCNSQKQCECGNHGKRAGETCSADVDCPACDHGVPKCEVHHGTTGHCHCAHAKRATCHNNHECDGTCPDGQNGVCNSQNHCECGNHGKRAGETCAADVDCPACDHGVPKCEVHHGTTGHCHCAHAVRAIVEKRAGESCATDADCPNCTHGVQKCEIHHGTTGHCHCAHAVRAIVEKRAGESCATDADCPNCTHGVQKCEIHHGTTGHCHCAHALRAIVEKRAGESCATDADCPNCTHGVQKCEIHHGTTGHCHCAHALRAIVEKRAGESCATDADCPNCTHGVQKCEIHHGTTGHCHCAHALRAIVEKRAGESCATDADCPNCTHGVQKCEIHHGTTGHCHCAHAKRSTCKHPHDCAGTCPDGQDGVCNSEGHCDCGNNGRKKRAGETCSADVDCPACDHGVPKCEKHNEHEGHCHCAHA